MRAIRATTAATRRRGAAALELAIVLPVLVTIVLGCVDFGRFASTYIAVTNSARAGAAYGCVTPVTVSSPSAMTAWRAGVRQRAVDELGGGYDPAQATVDAQIVPPPVAPGPVWVTVEVTYPFDTVVPWPLLPRHLTPTQAVQIRVIR